MTWCSIVLDDIGAVAEMVDDGAEHEVARENVESRTESEACGQRLA